MTQVDNKTVDLTPTWRTAVTIYAEVLKNPKAGIEAQESATEELLRLAGIVDDMNKRDEGK